MSCTAQLSARCSECTSRGRGKRLDMVRGRTNARPVEQSTPGTAAGYVLIRNCLRKDRQSIEVEEKKLDEETKYSHCTAHRSLLLLLGRNLGYDNPLSCF